mgnify:CR=1 FL=1
MFNMNELRNKNIKQAKYIFAAEYITQQTLNSIIRKIEIGMTEKEIARILDQSLFSQGIKALSFPTIVAIGKHSATPHHEPTNTKVVIGTHLLIDVGAKYQGFCGDITRTIFVGKPNKKYIYMFNLVEEARQKAFALIKPGTKIADIDKAVRSVFAREKVEALFIHTTGHGISKKIHDNPSLNQYNTDLLEEGMILMIEPGLYDPGWGGVRIEDMIQVTQNGYQFISQPDQLLTLYENEENIRMGS